MQSYIHGHDVMNKHETYTVVQIKTCHCIFVHNFGKCEPIFKKFKGKGVTR
jgi:hypothetical protein